MAQQKYGDDFPVGFTFRTPSITVTETHIVNWAGLTMDFYPLHMDQEYAAKSVFGERIAHGPLIFGMAVGLVAMSGVAGDAAMAWLGVDNMKMLAPVKIGDTIHVFVEVISAVETSKPDRAVHTWRYQVKNQREEVVLVFDFKLMMHRKTH
jgi:itaconyl-CoA hydratase